MNFIKAVGKEVFSGDKSVLLRGFGLGGWFLPEGYMWKLFTKCDRPRKMEAMVESLCGKAYSESFWQQYLDHYITKKDIELIAKEGFNSVRLPLNARHLYEKKGEQLTLIPEMLSKVDQLIEWCRSFHIYVILDMHAAPGGQTGQNIDDSEADLPYLFMKQSYEEELVFLWKELAKRYCNEAVVAGYDLLNEPLPDFFGQYNDQVLPLYQKLIREIREVDKNHMIILEGVHWASDFSIFDAFTREEAADNIMLQFHKYWNNPDAESLEAFIKASEILSVPLFMGEGGENNCDWYTTAFPLYEKLNISWSFWTYKKMECTNSPITFEIPEGWDELIRWIDGECELTTERAIDIFDLFIQSIQNEKVNKGVFCALKRELPVKIPCEAYDDYHIVSERISGVNLRKTDPVSLIFENGKTGDVDYKRYGGEEQPMEENILVQLFPGDRIAYQFYNSNEKVKIDLQADGQGELLASINGNEKMMLINEKSICSTSMNCIPNKKQLIWVTCVSGSIKLDWIYLSH